MRKHRGFDTVVRLDVETKDVRISRLNFPKTMARLPPQYLVVRRQRPSTRYNVS